MDILDDALKFVRNFEDELLPMIHQNWHGLVRKFDRAWNQKGLSDSQKIVAARAVEVAETMCKLSLHFVYLKIVNELRPKLIEFMSAVIREVQTADRSFTHTASYRLTLSILKASPTFLTCAGEWSSEEKQSMLNSIRPFSDGSIRFEEMRKLASYCLEKSITK